MTTWGTQSVGPASANPGPERFKRGNPSDLVMPQSAERPLNWREGVLLKVLKIAIANGWQGWKTHVNDAVTVGQEAEGVLRDYRKGNKPIEPLIFDRDFSIAAGYDLIGLVMAQDRLKWMRENI